MFLPILKYSPTFLLNFWVVLELWAKLSSNSQPPAPGSWVLGLQTRATVRLFCVTNNLNNIRPVPQEALNSWRISLKIRKGLCETRGSTGLAFPLEVLVSEDKKNVTVFTDAQAGCQIISPTQNFSQPE